jgi:hypothetical protein
MHCLLAGNGDYQPESPSIQARQQQEMISLHPNHPEDHGSNWRRIQANREFCAHLIHT